MGKINIVIMSSSNCSIHYHSFNLQSSIPSYMDHGRDFVIAGVLKLTNNGEKIIIP